MGEFELEHGGEGHQKHRDELGRVSAVVRVHQVNRGQTEAPLLELPANTIRRKGWGVGVFKNEKEGGVREDSTARHHDDQTTGINGAGNTRRTQIKSSRTAVWWVYSSTWPGQSKMM